jgi:Skp family chaperone for outer membrane proteins
MYELGKEQERAALELLLSQRGEEISQKQAEINELANALEEARRTETRLQGLSADLKGLKAKHSEKVAELAGWLRISPTRNGVGPGRVR